ncbi:MULTISPECIES: hypothetical protein [Streptomyces]|uniref:Lipoprotein n=1 Tax=Streptomyces doudnae TaxID=3075536 RepID=A0ABD5ELJ5_9ACTN|nr:MULTISPECIES: hypothetical protein [unclassified Streptomyces]MDT0435259.1 hypothetical protein [Streptomyces sp. DSM 41981]MYQ63532.1 hypothetical protein [Streptomyces sp. SID4950]
MAGRGRASRTAAVLLALLLVGLVSCGGRHTGNADTARLQRVLDRRAAAVLAGDRAAFLATGTLGWFENLRAVPLAAWSYRVTSLRGTGDDATADAELSYRVRGWDRAPVTVHRALALSRKADGQWSVDAERPAAKAPQLLWDQGRVTAVRGAHALVLGVGQSQAALRSYADLADRAVPAVSGAWGSDWAARVMVLVPRSLEGMAGLLGTPPSSYRGIAAVTTGEVGGAAKAPADRVIVNPDAYAVLGDLGRQVVLTHETTHVASRAHTSAATPLWLSEGYADWVGYRGTGRTPRQAAPELERAVAAGRTPKALPTDDDFGFGSDATALARAYEGGWLACRMIADEWGEERLGRFYRAVGDHQGRSGSVAEALRQVLGTTPERFTARWRDYLDERLG